MRRTYNRLTIARRHSTMFARMAMQTKNTLSRIEYWPTGRDGLHVVEIHKDHTVRQVGWLWL